jgi:predicted TIM-barrel fold metal-dependent hydrolase
MRRTLGTIRGISGIAAWFGLSVLVIISQSGAGRADALYFVDAHSQVGRSADLDRIVPLMNSAGVRHTILSAMREVRNRDVAALAKKHPNELTASIGLKGSPYIKNQSRFAESLQAAESSGRFGAISEALVSHQQKANQAPLVELEISSPQVQAALDVALRHKWPFVVHIEFASAAGKRATRLKADFQSLVRRYPTHPFVLIHLGQLPPQEAAELIAQHSNLFFMTSRADPVDLKRSQGRQPWENMFDGKAFKPAWRELLSAQSDRFVFAMDNHIADSHWNKDAYLQRTSLWREALQDLPPAAANAIAHGNAERLWNLPRP